jgi:hypothetical protein
MSSHSMRGPKGQDESPAGLGGRFGLIKLHKPAKGSYSGVHSVPSPGAPHWAVPVSTTSPPGLGFWPVPQNYVLIPKDGHRYSQMHAVRSFVCPNTSRVVRSSPTFKFNPLEWSLPPPHSGPADHFCRKKVTLFKIEIQCFRVCSRIDKMLQSKVQVADTLGKISKSLQYMVKVRASLACLPSPTHGHFQRDFFVISSIFGVVCRISTNTMTLKAFIKRSNYSLNQRPSEEIFSKYSFITADMQCIF